MDEKRIKLVSDAILDAFDMTSESPLFYWDNPQELRIIAIAVIEAANGKKFDWSRCRRESHASPLKS
jgi:hypothetical protein